MLIGYFIWRTNSRSLLALSLAWWVGSKTLHHQTPSLHPNFFMGILKLLRQSSYSSRLWEHIGTFYEQSKFTVLTAAPLHSVWESGVLWLEILRLQSLRWICVNDQSRCLASGAQSSLIPWGGSLQRVLQSGWRLHKSSVWFLCLHGWYA